MIKDEDIFAYVGAIQEDIGNLYNITEQQKVTIKILEDKLNKKIDQVALLAWAAAIAAILW